MISMDLKQEILLDDAKVFEVSEFYHQIRQGGSSGNQYLLTNSVTNLKTGS